jgi:deoxyribodipyrimidine photolyase-related protein
MTKALILLPNQLFEKHDKHEVDTKNIFIWLHPKFFSDLKFHKNKLVFHYATILAYQKKLSKNYSVRIIEDLSEAKKLEKIIMYDPTDFEIDSEIKRFCKKNKIELELLQTKLFLLNSTELEEYNKSTKKPYFNHTFYVWIRNKTQILMNGCELININSKRKNMSSTDSFCSKPVGGSYSYDTENRLPFKPTYKEGKIKLFSNVYIKKAISIVEKKFPNNPGEITPFIPITHQEALRHFNKFLKERLKDFGSYEDAFREDVQIGFHSNISALLNVGLLDVRKVIDLTLKYYKKHKSPIQSVEGFLRQIISWREYVRMLYIYEHEKFNKMNFFKHHRKINKNWFDGSTMIKPVDDVIKKVNVLSYAHHIERLMILSNFALLTQIEPKEIYNWFLSFVSIDAYEWVMEPNVYGMGIHSVGQLMMNRPYFSSSNYLFKMSGNQLKKNKGEKILLGKEEYEWDEVWDCLYYNFINKNKIYLKKIYSTASAVAHLNKKSSSEITKLTKIANLYLKKY